METTVAQLSVQLSHENDVVTMATKRNPLWLHADWCISTSTSELRTFAILERSYSINNYGVEVIFNYMTSLLNFMKIYEFVQTLLVEGATDRQTYEQTGSQDGDLISLTSHFLMKVG
jgi:hypothetical protein